MMMKKTFNRYFIVACLFGAGALFANTFYIQAKAKLAQYLIAQAWEETLSTQQATPPWSWADTHPVAKLKVKRLAIEQYVLAGADGRPLAFAPGLYAGTKDFRQQPQDKRPDSVIAGHHNTHFDFLKHLVTGDKVTLQNPKGQTIDYQVSHIQHFDIRQQQLPAYFTGNTVQLVTCLPSYVGEIHPNQRLVVTLVRKNPQNSDRMTVNQDSLVNLAPKMQ